MWWCIGDCLWIKKHCNTECKRWLIDVDYRCIFWGIRRNEAVSVLNNSGLEDKVVLLMEFIQIKHPLKELKKDHLVEFILDTFTQVLMESGTELHGKSSMNWKKLIKNTILQIVMMLN